MSEIITEKEKYVKGWTGGLPETPCGAGSRMNETRKQRSWIPALIAEYGIKTIADIGAGDLHWIKHTEIPEHVAYTPFDLVPRHPEVQEFDLLGQAPPKVDLIMCLWVLNHFPRDHCRVAIENIKLSGSKYLLVTDRQRYHKDQPHEFIALMKNTLETMRISPRDDWMRLIAL